MVWAALKALGAVLARVPWQVWAALGIAFGVMYFGHVKFKAGYAEATAHYQAIQTQRLAEIAKLQQQIRDQENEHAQAMDAIGQQHAAELSTLEDRARRDRDAARSGDFRLRVPVSICAGAGTAESSAVPARNGDGPATVELPRAITEDLLELANDADRVADQLRSCQAVIRADRE